jgi:hypothetical protein
MLGLFGEAEYAYRLALRLASTPRFTGSKGEAEARELLARELSSFGYSVSFEPFKVKVYEVEQGVARGSRARSRVRGVLADRLQRRDRGGGG